MVAGLDIILYIFFLQRLPMFSINFIDYSMYIYFIIFLSHGAVLCVYVGVYFYLKKFFMNVF